MSKHPLEEKWNTTAADILTAIEHGFRAQADVKGKLAELYLFRRLEKLQISAKSVDCYGKIKMDCPTSF